MMVVDEPWENMGQPGPKLTAKINHYLHFIRDGQLYEDFPQNKGLPVKIVFCAVPTVEATRFLDQTRESLAPHNVGLELAHPR